METIEKDHPQYVEPLLLRDVYGMAYEDIAQLIDAPARDGEGADPPRPQARAAAAPGASDAPPRPPVDWRRPCPPRSWLRARCGRRSRAAAGPRLRRGAVGSASGQQRAPDDEPSDGPASGPIVSDRVEPDLDARRSDAGRGLRLSRRRRPRRRRAALRPRPRRGSPSRAPHRHGDDHLPRGPRRARSSRSTSRPGLEVASLPSTASRCGVHPSRQGPRRRRRRSPRTASYELVIDYAGKPAPGPGARPRAATSRTLGFTVTDARRGVDDAGAVRRLQLVSRERPARRQGALRHLRHRAGAVDRARQRRARRPTRRATAQRTTDVPARRAGVVLPHHHRHRRLRALERHLEERRALDYWYPRGQPLVLDDMATGDDASTGSRRGSGPTRSAPRGIVATDSMSAMETQTMVTIGNNDYVRSAPVLVHELVAPVVRRPGLARRLARRVAQRGHDDADAGALRGRPRGRPDRGQIARWRGLDQGLRDDYGPPGDYDKAQFGGSNIYYSPALMWNELRLELGDDEFFRIARSWLAATTTSPSTRDDSTPTGRRRPASSCRRSSTRGSWAGGRRHRGPLRWLRGNPRLHGGSDSGTGRRVRAHGEPTNWVSDHRCHSVSRWASARCWLSTGSNLLTGVFTLAPLALIDKRPSATSSRES